MTWGKIITGSTSKENCCRAKKRKLKLTKVKLNLTKNPKATSKYKETKIPLSKKKGKYADKQAWTCPVYKGT